MLFPGGGAAAALDGDLPGGGGSGLPGAAALPGRGFLASAADLLAGTDGVGTADLPGAGCGLAAGAAAFSHSRLASSSGFSRKCRTASAKHSGHLFLTTESFVCGVPTTSRATRLNVPPPVSLGENTYAAAIT